MNFGRSSINKLTINIEKALFYIEVSLIIFFSGAVPQAIESSEIYISLFNILMLIIAAYMMLKSFSLKTCKSILLCTMLAFLYFIINVLNYSESFTPLLLRVIWFVLFFGMCNRITRKNWDFEHIFYRIILFVAFISLLFYFLICIANVNIPYTMIRTKGLTVYYNYLNLGLFYINPIQIQELPFGLNLYKLSSIFWEHGVYAIYLNLALFYQLFILENRSKIRFCIIAISVLFTFSMVGIGVFVILITVFCYKNTNISQKIRYLLSVPIIAIAGYIIYLLMIYKKSTTSYVMGSYMLRMNDIIVGIRVFLENFVLGTGFLNTKEFTVMQGLNRGNSNGIITIMFTLGIVGVLIIAIPFFINILNQHNKKHKIINILFGTILILSNMAEPIYMCPIMIYYIAREYNSIAINKKEIKLKKL